MPLIEVRGLRFAYDSGSAALDGVDFTLDAHETVAFLGANGSGKTTFLLTLIGVLNGTGDIRVCGLPVRAPHVNEVRRKIGFLFQDPDDQLFLPTVLEDVSFGPRQSGCTPEEAQQRAGQALRLVGMERGWDRPPHLLSGGEKQRVALAGLLAARPEILILDEPTTHLDPPGRRQMIRLLRQLPQAKIIVTHDVGFARQLATRAVFFENGRIGGDGDVEEIIRRFDWETENHRSE